MAAYGQMDQVLQLINTRFVSLDDKEIEITNDFLKSIIECLLIPKMMKIDELFREIYNAISYGGSYYDGLKVGKPDEFDLALKLSLPKCKTHSRKNCKKCIHITSCREAPGFVHFKVKETQSEQFNGLIEDGYVQSNRIIKKWFKSIVQRALNEIESELKLQAALVAVKVIEIYEQTEDKFKHICDEGLFMPSSESGPAITLRMRGKFGRIDIDLVPAFEFDREKWPENFRPNPSLQCNNFLIVPKGTRSVKNSNGRYWRPSFQEQETELIHNQQRLKPALRLLKKMRSSHHKKIPSYALKTIVLWDLESVPSFNYNKSLSECFLHLARNYRDRLYVQDIPYYWNAENNLFCMKGVDSRTLEDHYNHINNILSKIEKEPANPYEITKFILGNGTEEYEQIIGEMKANDEKYHLSNYASYEDIELYLLKINAKYLRPEKKKLAMLESFVKDNLLCAMRQRNTMFDKMCQEKTFSIDHYVTGFSHNICIALSLPKCEICNVRNCQCVTISQSDNPKFLFVTMKPYFCPSWNIFANNKYFRGDYVLFWLQGVIEDALGNVQLPDEIHYCKVDYCQFTPAIILEIGGQFGVSFINVIPAFDFTYDQLPQHFRRIPTKYENVFITPAQDGGDKHHWWPCFYYQEKELLKDKQKLTSAFKLLKEFRDNQLHLLIPDYALKTMLLELSSFDYSKSLGDSFMYVIEKYKEKLHDKMITYYWRNGKRVNLLNSKGNEFDDYYTKIEKEISDFKKISSIHPEFIARIILGGGTKKYDEFIEEVNEENLVKNRSKAQIWKKEREFSDDSDSDSERNDDFTVANRDFDNYDSGNSSSAFRGPTRSSRYSYNWTEYDSGNSSSTLRGSTRFSLSSNDFTPYGGPSTSRRNDLSARNSQSTTENTGNGWAIAAGVVGAAAVLGIGLWGALAKKKE